MGVGWVEFDGKGGVCRGVLLGFEEVLVDLMDGVGLYSWLVG